MNMAFEIELLDERFDIPEENIWRIISLYWEAAQREPYLSAFALDADNVPDIRDIKKWRGDYDGIGLELIFPKDGNKLIWFGVTQVGNGPFNDHEHVLGFIEVQRALISSDTPVDVRIVCGWRPFYLFFKGMADTLLSYYKRQPVDQAIREVLDFKSLVERQTYKDIFVHGRPQENIARALLQTFLIRRSYREVPVRGGQSDILVFDRQGCFLYETKIWRGAEYYMQGVREIEEYIEGEDSDKQLAGAFYILFDPTVSAVARRYRGSDLTTEIIAKYNVRVVVVNINPPKPSKKPIRK
jgi:hypothetical protein